MKVINFLTEKESHDTHMSRTKDNKWVDKITYDKACLYYRDGLIDSNQIKNYLKAQKELVNTFAKYGIRIISYCRKNGLNATKFIKNMRAKEEQMSVEEFRKSHNTLDIEESIIIWNALLETEDKLSNKSYGGKYGSEKEDFLSLSTYETNFILKDRLVERYFEGFSDIREQATIDNKEQLLKTIKEFNGENKLKLLEEHRKKGYSLTKHALDLYVDELQEQGKVKIERTRERKQGNASYIWYISG